MSKTIDPHTAACFDRVADWLAKKAAVLDRPLLVGLNGAQGSGKSTLAHYWSNHFKRQSLHACVLSIDDFYLSHQDRRQLSKTVHPLLATRGVPGTHDIAKAQKVIHQLLTHQLPIVLPRFNKATDDPYPETTCPLISEPQDLVILEGWCVGAIPQTPLMLQTPVNDLERCHDANGAWRQFVNSQLSGQYQALFKRLDVLVMLKAPNFSCVANWRLEQEKSLEASLNAQERQAAVGLMSERDVKKFVAFYQRLTEAALSDIPKIADVVLHLDHNRTITGLTGKAGLNEPLKGDA